MEVSSAVPAPDEAAPSRGPPSRSSLRACRCERERPLRERARTKRAGRGRPLAALATKNTRTQC
eukprot:scaffold275491_cov28-Tisochrysis_lutea.AAC.2